MKNQAAVSVLAAIMCLAHASASFAGPFQYDCEVKRTQVVSKDGLLRRSALSFDGRNFTVSRETGEIVGTPFALSREQGWIQFRVLDRGSDEQSYKFIAVSPGPYTHTIYLEIQEFESGPLKPFVHIDNGAVMTGVCR